MKRPTVGKRYKFEPVGLDVWDRRSNTPEPGEIVTAIKSPYGTPPSGAMGHTYVEGSKGLALVLVNSLQEAKDVGRAGPSAAEVERNRAGMWKDIDRMAGRLRSDARGLDNQDRPFEELELSSSLESRAARYFPDADAGNRKKAVSLVVEERRKLPHGKE